MCLPVLHAEQSKQASSARPVKSCSTPTLHHRNPHHPHRASYSCACLHVRHARSSRGSAYGHCHLLDRHLLPYGRMITSTDDLPILLQSPDSVCHSLRVCIGSYSLASSVRNISDLPSPLGLTHMGLAATRAPRSFNLLVIDVTFKLHPVALSRTTFSIFSVHHLCMSFQRDRTMHSSIGQVTD